MNRRIHNQFFLFALSGLAGFIVDASIVWILTKHSINAIPAQGVAFFAAVLVTWILNRKITFARHASHKWQRELMHYVAANSVGATVTNGVYVFLILNTDFFNRSPVFAVAVGALAGLIFNFVVSRIFVFKEI
jgi:putative flippase GtrA